MMNLDTQGMENMDSLEEYLGISADWFTVHYAA